LDTDVTHRDSTWPKDIKVCFLAHLAEGMSSVCYL